MPYSYTRTNPLSTLLLHGTSTKDLNCVYTSVYCSDKRHLSNITSQITDYQKNIKMRNILFVDLKPFYECALKGDLTPFEQLEMQFRKN
jgi:hypothetical protein